MGRRRGSVGVQWPQITTESKHSSQGTPQSPQGWVPECFPLFWCLSLSGIPLCPLPQELPWPTALQYHLHIPAHKAMARPQPILSLTSHFSASFFSVSLSKNAAEPPGHQHQGLSPATSATMGLWSWLQISPGVEISLLWQWFHGTGLPSTPHLFLFVVV